MAEILRALGSEEAEAYIPMRELGDGRRSEVYETVGTYLASLYELDEDLVEDGCFLIGLDNGQQVAFPYGVGAVTGIEEAKKAVVTYEDTMAAVKAGAFRAVVEHWRKYDNQPANERLGDEHIWDAALADALVDFGIRQTTAHSLCAAAKLEARSL